MTRQWNWMSGYVVMALTISSIGCGQGFKSQGPAQAQAQTANAAHSTPNDSTPNVSEALAKAQQATVDAQTAMADAQATVATISDANGNINVSLFTNTARSIHAKGLLAPVIARIQPIFDRVFSRAQAVKVQFESARATLAAAIAKFDKNIPAEAALIAQVTQQMGRIDALEQQFRKSMQVLAGKLNLASLALDKVISGATSFIPGFGGLANLAIDYFVMADVKTMISDFKLKLLAL